MADLDQHYYNLKNQKSANERQQTSTQSEIDSIDSKIDRLHTAYNNIDAAKESIKNLKKANSKLPNSYKNIWKGNNANTIFEDCNDGDLQQNYKNYIDSIDYVEDAINQEICSLKNMRSQKCGILRGLINAWNTLSTEIRNYFN